MTEPMARALNGLEVEVEIEIEIEKNNGRRTVFPRPPPVYRSRSRIRYPDLDSLRRQRVGRFRKLLKHGGPTRAANRLAHFY